MPFSIVLTANDLIPTFCNLPKGTLCNIPEGKEVVFFTMLGHELQEAIDVDSVRAISQYANDLNDFHLVDATSIMPLFTIRNDPNMYQTLASDVYTSEAPHRHDDLTGATTTSPDHVILTATTSLDRTHHGAECNVCVSRPSHRLIPCEHTICYDHFLQHDEESNSTRICAHCSKPVTSTVELDDNSHSQQDLLLLCQPLNLSPSRSRIWSSPTRSNSTLLPSLTQRISTISIMDSNDGNEMNQQQSQGKRAVNPDAPAFVPRASARATPAPGTTLNGASQAFKPAQKRAASRPAHPAQAGTRRAYQAIVPRPDGAIQIGAHHPINYAQSAAGHAAKVAQDLAAESGTGGDVQSSAPQPTSALQSPFSLLRRPIPHPPGAGQKTTPNPTKAVQKGTTSQKSASQVMGPPSYSSSTVQNGVSQTVNGQNGVFQSVNTQNGVSQTVNGQNGVPHTVNGQNGVPPFFTGLNLFSDAQAGASQSRGSSPHPVTQNSPFPHPVNGIHNMNNGVTIQSDVTRRLPAPGFKFNYNDLNNFQRSQLVLPQQVPTHQAIPNQTQQHFSQAPLTQSVGGQQVAPYQNQQHLGLSQYPMQPQSRHLPHPMPAQSQQSGYSQYPTPAQSQQHSGYSQYPQNQQQPGYSQYPQPAQSQQSSHYQYGSPPPTQTMLGPQAYSFTPFSAFHELSPARNNTSNSAPLNGSVLPNPQPRQQNMNMQQQQSNMNMNMNSSMNMNTNMQQQQQGNMQRQMNMAPPMTNHGPIGNQPSSVMAPQTNIGRNFDMHQNNAYANNVFRPQHQSSASDDSQMTNGNNFMPASVADDPFTMNNGQMMRAQNGFNAARPQSVGESTWGPPVQQQQLQQPIQQQRPVQQQQQNMGLYFPPLQPVANMGAQYPAQQQQQQPVANMGTQYPVQQQQQQQQPLANLGAQFQQQPMANMALTAPQPQNEAARIAQAIKENNLEKAKSPPPAAADFEPLNPQLDQLASQPHLPSQNLHIIEYHADPDFLAHVSSTRPTIDVLNQNTPFANYPNEAKPCSYGVIKISNIPYGTNKCEVVAALGPNTRLVSQPAGTPFYAIHIIMERATGKTMDCFVELETVTDAKNSVAHFQHRQETNRPPLLDKRRVDIELSSQEELMRELFPRVKCCNWDGQMPVIYSTDEPFNSGFQGFVTGEEMVMVQKHAETPQRSPFAQRCHRRTYECMISILYKYPWFAVDHVTIAERALIFKVCIALIRSLVLAVKRQSVDLSPLLLQELTTASLVNVGFSAQQKSYIADFVALNGFPEIVDALPKVNLGIYSAWWPFEVLTRRKNASLKLLGYYVSLLAESAEEPIDTPSKRTGIFAQRALTASASKVNPASPFGHFKIVYPDDKMNLSLATASFAEWNSAEDALRKAITESSDDSLLAITSEADAGGGGE